jgi:glycosyltransferase involved in cell wall biosynthesis
MGLSGVQRTLKFVKYMNEFNWEPTVVTSSNVAYFAHDESLLAEAENAHIKIVRTSGKDINSKLAKRGTVRIPPEFIRKTLSRISNTIFIPDNKKGWAKKALLIAEELLKKEEFNLIFVTAPPFSSISMAIKLKNEFSLPLVVDYRDLWYGNQFAFYPTPIHRYLHKRMEYAAHRAADKIIVTNRKMKEKILKRYKFLTFEDIYIISHGYDPEDFKDLSAEPKLNNKLWITYAGLFYEFITPKYFLKAFKKLYIEHPEVADNIELHFLGFLRNENKKLVKKLGLQKFVKEFGYLNHKEALSKIITSDVLWMMVGHGRNADTISSGKLYEYFGTRKPIIANLPEGALRLAAKDYGASFVTEPYDIDEIKNTILKVYELYVAKQLPKPNENFVEKHKRDLLTGLLTKQFQFLIKEDIK